jgi:hypothetical protein
MTTITLKNSVILDRYEFEDIDDLILSLFRLKDVNPIDFHELSEEEIEEDTKKLIELSKSQSLDEFTSISSS